MPIAVSTDIEWASELAIAELFGLADECKVPLFPFLTHPSEFLHKRGGAQGIHPNFLPGSTQGKTEKEVLDYCFRLVPGAKAFRSHCFYSHTRLQWAMAERGITMDSNLLSYMKWIRPFHNIGGYITYPVFWSDDVAKRRGETKIERIRFNNNVTLVVNVHPNNASLPIVRDLLSYARERCVPFESLIP